jgi:hypothetical protein
MEKERLGVYFATSNQRKNGVDRIEASWLLTIPLFFPTNTSTQIPFLTNGMYELNVPMEFCGHLIFVAFDKELKFVHFLG